MTKLIRLVSFTILALVLWSACSKDEEPEICQVFKTAEIDASYKGCEILAIWERERCTEDKVASFVEENLKYPEIAIKNNIEGIVEIELILEVDGSVKSVTAKTNIGFGLEEESIRVFNLLTDWNPAKFNGENVKFYFSYNVEFKL